MEKNDYRNNLAMAALDEIPTPNSNSKKIIGLVKEKGQITGYQLSDESIVMKDQALDMARNGEIEGVGIAHNKDTEYLKSLPDGMEINNLGSLPTVDSNL